MYFHTFCHKLLTCINNINEKFCLLPTFQANKSNIRNVSYNRSTHLLNKTLINEFMRYIYIPYINRISIEKINKDIANLQKLPTD